MDIDKEIAKIKNRKGNFELIIDTLQEQKNQIDRQIHIVSVVTVACDIQDMIKEGDFSKFNLSKLFLTFKDDHDYGNVLKYYYSAKDGNKINKVDNFSDFISQLDEKFEIISGFELDSISDLFKEKGVSLNLDESFENNFIDLMLSKDLKAMLEKAELQNSLPINSKVNKKIKM